MSDPRDGHRPDPPPASSTSPAAPPLSTADAAGSLGALGFSTPAAPTEPAAPPAATTPRFGPGREPVIVVIGAGIGGLTAAYRLLTESRRTSHGVRVVVLEAAPRTGGLIRTRREGPLLMECGPDNFITAKPAGLALVRELGLEPELIGTNPAWRRSLIARGDRLVPVPEGFYLMAPCSREALDRTDLFTAEGKARIWAETDVPARTDGADESLTDFVRRRFGEECLVRLAQPMIAGITTADPATLSMAALMPQFPQMEREHGSVIRALAARQAADPTAAEVTSGGPRYSLFVTLRGGMQALTDALARRLPGGAVRLGHEVRSLRREDGRWRIGFTRTSVPETPRPEDVWRVRRRSDVGSGWTDRPGTAIRRDSWGQRIPDPRGPAATIETIEADGVIASVPAWSAAEFLSEAAPEAAAELARIDYAPCAMVNMTFAEAQVRRPLEGLGFVVPAAEGRFVIACSFSSVKYEGRAPAGTVLVRAFVGGALRAEDVGVPDDEMIGRAVGDLRVWLDLDGGPRSATVSRWMRSMPQYKVGHLDRAAAIEASLAALPGFALAGNCLRGVGIPDTITSAENAARRVLATL